MAIRDLHPVKDKITTFGSTTFADSPPDHNSATVARLLCAGAIMHTLDGPRRNRPPA